MHSCRLGITRAIVTLTALGLASCASQSIVPKPLEQGAGYTMAAPYANRTPIPLLPGMSIGVNTFRDGDTSTGGQGQNVDGLPCSKHMSETFHIHVHLSIFDPGGKQIMVPWAVGIVAPWTFNRAKNIVIGGKCFYNLHTHDRSGVIHDEAKTNLNLTLGTFFDIWGEPLDANDVAGYAGTVWVKIITPAHTGPWTTSIDPRTILLTEHEQISLAVVKPVIPVPKYRFTY